MFFFQICSSLIYSYLRFGEAVEPVIPLNLPNTPLYDSLKIILALMIMATYVTQVQIDC